MTGPVDPVRAGGITVVIPCYRSELTLPELVARLMVELPAVAPAHEVVLVVDGSPDDTAGVARREAARYPTGRVRVIELRRNYGQHNALLAGVASARFGVTVTMDDDLQHRPEEIHTLVAPLRDPAVDLVYGVPVDEEHGVLRSLASRSVKSALALTGVPNARDVSAFRAFRTDLRDGFGHVTDPFVSLDVVLSWVTTAVRRERVEMDVRRAGRSNYSVTRLVLHALNMATGYSVLPLRLVTVLGLLVSGFGLLALVTVLVMYWTGRVQVAGFTTTVAMLGLVSGTVMMSLGIIGEYIGRLHVRSMQRPAYVVRPAELGQPPAAPDRGVGADASSGAVS